MQRSPRDLALYVFFAVGALVIALEVIGPFHWAIPLKTSLMARFMAFMPWSKGAISAFQAWLMAPPSATV